MKTMTGKTESRHSTLAEVLAMETGDQAAVHGMVHTLRDLGDVRFALLRMPQGVLQCVLSGEDMDVRDGDAVVIAGEVVRDERAPGGAELHAQRVEVLSAGGGGDARADWQKQDEPVAGYRAVASVRDTAQPA